MNEFFHDATSLVRIAESKDTKNSEQSLAIKKKLDVGVQKNILCRLFSSVTCQTIIHTKAALPYSVGGDEDKAAVYGCSTLAGSPPAR